MPFTMKSSGEYTIRNEEKPKRETCTDISNNNNAKENSEKAAEEYDACLRYSDGSVRLRNPHIEQMEEDFLYHLALGNSTHNFVEMFGDVKFVCMGGTHKRMETFAKYLMEELDYKLPTGTMLEDITMRSNRFCMYKVGPVLSVSHGMGAPSVGILLVEMIKLMYYAKVKDPIFFRIGTSGGIGLKPGSVVVSNGAVNGLLKEELEMVILGKRVNRPAKLNQKLVQELISLADPKDPYEITTGKTMCADDFYEGQGRLDGAFCDYTEADKMEYLHRLHKHGVANIEMEATVIGALTHHAGVKTAIVCATLINRLDGDQVTTPKSVLEEWQLRPQKLIAKYIKKYLEENGNICSSVNGNLSN